MMSVISLRHDMLGDAVYTDSLGKSFICSPEKIFYAYYTGAPGHSIEDGMSSRDQVQDWINSETVVFTSDQRGILSHTQASRLQKVVRVKKSIRSKVSSTMATIGYL